MQQQSECIVVLVQLSATFFHDPIVSPSLVALEVFEEYAACRDFPVVADSPRLQSLTARTVAGAHLPWLHKSSSDQQKCAIMWPVSMLFRLA